MEKYLNQVDPHSKHHCKTKANFNFFFTIFESQQSFCIGFSAIIRRKK